MRLFFAQLRAEKVRVLLAIALGAAVIASNMGLLAAAAYLIAAASVWHLMALLIIPMYAVRLLSATRATARYGERLVSHRVTLDILVKLRLWLYDCLTALGPAGMQGTRSGDTLGRALANIDELQNAYLLVAAPLAVGLAIAALTVGVLLLFSGALAWATLLYMAMCGGVVPLAAAAAARHAGSTLVQVRADLDAHLVDSIQGMRDILSNGAETRALDETTALVSRVARAENRLALVRACREGAAELLTGWAMLTALVLAVPLVARQSIPGLYVAVPALLVLAAFEAIRPLGAAGETVSGVRAAGARVMARGRGVRQMQAVGREGRQPPPDTPSRLCFERVTMYYETGRRPALRDVSIEIRAGQWTALVGPSGAGKSTLAHLITRSWEPASGRVLIGDHDVRAYDPRALRLRIGVVAQDTYIFNDTMRNNLLLANPEATEEEMVEALAAVDLADAVHDLPNGLDTWVGEHGNALSGGERQRLAVARVLLQDAPIVVLDEVTANLDPRTEAALLATLRRALAERTVVTITHRLVGLDHCAEIIVLDGGTVVERGTHDELRNRPGLYRRMLDIQEDMIAV